MKVTLFQQDIVWGDPKANRVKLEKLFDKAGSADLYVLPEMFSTGFVTANPELAEALPSPTLNWMKEQAALRNCAIAGSVAIHEDGRYFNRFYFVTPDGQVEQYDKRHLFSYGGENKFFTAGNKRKLVLYKGIRFCIFVCYDLRFPVWIRNRRDCDCLIFVANWPDKRKLVWENLTVARAIENECYVLAVNRCGSDPVCTYNGGTKVVHPFGEELARCPDRQESFVSCEIDIDVLNECRKNFPVANEADNFEIL